MTYVYSKDLININNQLNESPFTSFLVKNREGRTPLSALMC